MTAKSVAGSTPMTRAGRSPPSPRVTRTSTAFSTTWALVRAKPSGVNSTPLPAPSPRRPRRSVTRTWTLTTLGPTVSTARITARL